MNEVLKAIRERRSHRAYNNRQILDKDIEEVVQAGIWSQSAFNGQPWRFTVIQNKKLLDQISEICVDVMLKSGNEVLQSAANSPSFSCFYHAPTVIIISLDTRVPGAVIDCAIAADNMCLAAHSLGLAACFLGGFATAFYEERFQDEFMKSLDLPPDFQPFFSVSLGYKAGAEPEAPPRKSKDEIVNYVK